MPEGVRAELRVDAPERCPLAGVSADGPSITGLSWTGSGETVTEEFRTQASVQPDSLPEVESVFDIGDERVFRFERRTDRKCACQAVEELGYPVSDVFVREGSLLLTLHLSDLAELRAVVKRLQSLADGVQVSCLVHGRTDSEEPDHNPSVVDMGRLTDRQTEVVETAYDMGYFEHPRSANATDVADELDITPSTFTQHLAAAQSKLLGELLSG